MICIHICICMYISLSLYIYIYTHKVDIYILNSGISTFCATAEVDHAGIITVFNNTINENITTNIYTIMLLYSVYLYAITSIA